MKLFRVHHLLFGLAVVAAWLTSESTGITHAWIGYGVAAMLLLRLALGAFHKRGFDMRRLLPSLTPAPAGQRGYRHPAIGRALSLALLLAVAGTAGTGIAMDGGGTLFGQSIRQDRGGEERENEEREHGEGHEESALAEIHETLGNLIVPLVLIHLFWMLLARRELAFYMLFLPRRQRPA